MVVGTVRTNAHRSHRVLVKGYGKRAGDRVCLEEAWMRSRSCEDEGRKEGAGSSHASTQGEKIDTGERGQEQV